VPGGPSEFSVSYGCGCSYVNWRVPARHVETHGWHLCPDHMAGLQNFRAGNRREYRIKHSCRCYYVVWRAAGAPSQAVGWGFCPTHMTEFKAFDEGQPT